MSARTRSNHPRTKSTKAGSPSKANTLDSLNALFLLRTKGVDNIRGIRYQILYSLKKALDVLLTEEHFTIRLEGIEDFDLKGISIGEKYYQVKTANKTWNLAKLKEPLKNFLGVLRANSTAQFVLAVNFPLPADTEIGKLAKYSTLSEKAQKELRSKIDPYLREIGATRVEMGRLLAAMSLETTSTEKLWNEVRDSIARAFSLGSDLTDVYVHAFVSHFLDWAVARKILTKLDLNNVRDEIGRNLARENEYQAYGRGLIDRLAWHDDGNKEDYLAGKQTRPSHIASGVDVRRDRWLRSISASLDKTKVCVIKASSGQGKSTLALRYAYENWQDYTVLLIQAARTEEDAEKIAQFLKFQRSLGIVPFIIIDNASWQKQHWGRVAQECVTQGGQVLVTIRSEDWVRFGEPSRIEYDVIEPTLELNEAHEIFQLFRKGSRLHPAIASAEHAYELLASPKLLIEYVYLLTHGQMLSDRLSEQIRSFNMNNDEPAKVVILRRVALASIAGVSLDIDSLFSGLTIRQDLQLIMESLRNEYLSIEGRWVSGLHWVRSAHLVRLLHSDFLNPAVTALDVLGTLSSDHVPAFIAGMCDIPQFDWDLFCLRIRAHYRNALPSVLVTMLDGFFHAGERLFFECNRTKFDIFIKKHGSAGQTFLSLYIPVNQEPALESTREALSQTNPAFLAELESTVRGMDHSVRGINLCRNILVDLAPPSRERLLADLGSTGLLYDWCRLVAIDTTAWPSVADEVLIKASPLFRIPLESCCAFLQGLFFQDRQKYDAWLRCYIEEVLSYFRLHTDSIELRLEANQLFVKYIPKSSQERTLNSQTMARLDALRSAFPFVEIYNAQAQWVLPSGLTPTHDESVKAIPRSNLYLGTDRQKFKVLPEVIDRAYRPATYYEFQQKWHSFRNEATSVIETLIGLLVKLLKSEYSLVQLQSIASLLQTLYQNLLHQSLFLPELPARTAKALREKFRKCKDWETHLIGSIRQFIELCVPNTDREQSLRLCHHNASKVLHLLPIVHEEFAELYRVATDYFDSASLHAKERRVYADWGAYMEAYASFDGNPIRNIRQHLAEKERVRGKHEQDKLRGALALVEPFGLDFVYPVGSIKIETFRYMPIGIHVADPKNFTTEVSYTISALAQIQESELFDYFCIVPIFDGARCCADGYKFSRSTLRNLAEDQECLWESFVIVPIENAILRLLGDIPLRIPRSLVAQTAFYSLRGELEMIRNHLESIQSLASSVQEFDKQLFAQHKVELQKHFIGLLDLRSTTRQVYADLIDANQEACEAIEQRTKQIETALA